ncbi:MAG TPA: DUF192 domain-containing protein [Candidatus Nitrosopolaris sp.]|nr:DUF192 domain-containing protein [Candidatus Nitrosopolaris sp.]
MILLSTIIGSTLVAGISLFVLGNSSATHTSSHTFLTGISIPSNRYLKADITVKGYKLLVDLALTQDQQTKGLAVKNHMNESEGMLFVFQQPSRPSFWMKDMKFPIDILWLGANRSVVYIVPNLQPCPSQGNCPGYAPSRDSLYVLETTAGFSHRHNITVGTQTNFHLVG